MSDIQIQISKVNATLLLGELLLVRQRSENMCEVLNESMAKKCQDFTEFKNEKIQDFCETLNDSGMPIHAFYYKKSLLPSIEVKHFFKIQGSKKVSHNKHMQIEATGTLDYKYRLRRLETFIEMKLDSLSDKKYIVNSFLGKAISQLEDALSVNYGEDFVIINTDFLKECEHIVKEEHCVDTIDVGLFTGIYRYYGPIPSFGPSVLVEGLVHKDRFILGRKTEKFQFQSQYSLNEDGFELKPEGSIGIEMFRCLSSYKMDACGLLKDKGIIDEMIEDLRQEICEFE